jgi:LL-H family phage holin
MNLIDITPIINAVVVLIAAAVSAFLIPWIKSKLTAQQRSELVAWAKIGVAAAEQVYTGSGRGAEKKQYVLDFLTSKGLAIDEDSVNAAIEAAVKQLNTEGLTIE